MKLVLLAFLSSVSVFAADLLNCESRSSDYNLVVSNSKSAVLTYGGEEILHGALKCTPIKLEEVGVPFLRRPVMRCQTPSVADSGYFVVIHQYASSNKFSAEVSKMRPWGFVKVADLTCLDR